MAGFAAKTDSLWRDKVRLCLATPLRTNPLAWPRLRRLSRSLHSGAAHFSGAPHRERAALTLSASWFFVDPRLQREQRGTVANDRAVPREHVSHRSGQWREYGKQKRPDLQEAEGGAGMEFLSDRDGRSFAKRMPAKTIQKARSDSQSIMPPVVPCCGLRWTA